MALAAGFALAGFGTLGTAVLLTPLRDHPLGSGFAVAASIVVIATSAALAGPAAGAIATIAAVLSFDFFLVPPSLDLKVGRAEDRWPVAALLIVGVGIVVGMRRRAVSETSAPSPNGQGPSRHVDRVTRLIEQRADPRDLVLAVGAELTALLAARRCRFEPGESHRRAAATGALRPGGRRGRRVGLPPVEVELPVHAGTHRLGCFVIEPTPEAIVPIAHRITAVILAGHLGRGARCRASLLLRPWHDEVTLMVSVLKRVLIGKPIATAEEGHQRLRKRVALPVFASDAISSTAYATDEILIVLLVQASVGAIAFDFLVPIAIVVAVLLVIVVLSYRQTIYAYPSGGGAYIVSKDNLGALPSLIAGASLLTDYILTVAVSVAGGVLAMQSAFGFESRWRVPLCLVLIAVLTVANLRGVRESGALFAPPTYVYVVMLIVLIGVGLFRVYARDLGAIPLDELSEEARHLAEQAQPVSVFMLLRAFSSGAVALSGVEAVSNGVPAFRKPESKNAAMTIAIMGAILGTCFLGVSTLASKLQPFRSEEDPTGIALMAEYVFGGKNVLFWLIQIATFAILVLAANTAYADFPRLSSIISRDGYLPRQMGNRGDRLVFSNGILFLAAIASILIIVFKGNITALIPLYAFGVFTGFTLSQTGMVVHHFREREPHWQLSSVINGVGALCTGVIALVVVVSKFSEGAWIPAVLIPILVVAFRSIHRHYLKVRESVTVDESYKPQRHTHTVVVLVGTVNRGVLDAIQYARELAPDRLIAVSVVTGPEEQEQLAEAWERFEVPIPVHTILSPYRELTGPVLAYLDELDADTVDDVITVIIPEFVTQWKTQWLHNQSAFALKARLLYRPNTVVTSVPVLVEGEHPE